MNVSFDEVKGKPFFGKKNGERKGSRRFVTLSDGFGEWVVKWWKGEWRIRTMRWNSKVTTSLQMRAMSVADERGTVEKVEEKYATFEAFSERLVRIVSLADAIKIVKWIQG